MTGIPDVFYFSFHFSFTEVAFCYIRIEYKTRNIHTGKKKRGQINVEFGIRRVHRISILHIKMVENTNDCLLNNNHTKYCAWFFLRQSAKQFLQKHFLMITQVLIDIDFCTHAHTWFFFIFSIPYYQKCPNF